MRKMKNTYEENGRIYFKGENCYYMVEDEIGEYRVYDDGEYEGKYCGSLEMLEGFANGSKALDYVLAGV